MEMKENVRVVKFGSAYALEQNDDGVWNLIRGEYAPPISKREAERICKAVNKAYAILDVVPFDQKPVQEALKKEGLSKEQNQLLELILREPDGKVC